MNESSQLQEVLREEDSRYAHYDTFAPIYNAHFGHFAIRIAPALDRMLLRHLPPRACVLDLCCGTGQLAGELSKRGFQVTGIDGSANMLCFARRNAPDATFLLDDARAFNLPQAFDAAVSTFDSINHILTVEELASVFSNVSRALCPGGMFVFDMNMEEGYLCRWRGAWQGVEENWPYTIQASYSPAAKLASNVVTLGEPNSDSAAEITFWERCYSETEVRQTLRAAGFGAVEVYDGHRDLNLLGEIGRSFFVCHKTDQADSGTPPQANEHDCETSRFSDAPSGHRKLHRNPETCIADGVWPLAATTRELGAESRRLKAIEEVLCTLPQKPYEQLQRVAASIRWFVPSDAILGQVFQTSPALNPHAPATSQDPYSRWVYLSPLLEQLDWSVVVTVTVHELGHLILNHQLVDLDPEAYDLQETEVRQAIDQWGFQPDADAAKVKLEHRLFQNSDLTSSLLDRSNP